jgi:phosphatidylinositol glycan class N
MASLLTLSVAAVLVHAILFVSIFDIYFTSPIEQGAVPQYYSLEPPAKRLVLFVADGLRADTAFSLSEDGSTPAPFIRKMIEYKGRWGVSHTHVPTESRPGHVALVAGFYEDVSAVTRGWQENPVEFDSVFNQSRHTWSWGSPDILPMFAKGAVEGRVDTFMYDAAFEDFADADASKLDTWVFDRVVNLFKRAETDQELASELRQDKIVFFLHLLGLDTNGHAHRPTSIEVIENLKLVDRGVEQIVSLFESYYGDDKTAYVFTADHGMTDWGSHGAGLPEETMTPLVCWGAGVKSPRRSSQEDYVYHDGLSERWKLDKYERIDVEQADITALMSTLIGVPIPRNSEGVLPIGYIHYNRAFSAEGLFANVRQLLEQLRVKEERLYSNSLPFLFRPFSKFTMSEMVERRVKINKLIKEKQYQMAIDLSKLMIDVIKEGVRYYHTYHRSSLFVTMTMGFCGWITCVVLTILQENTKRRQPIYGAGSSPQGVPTVAILLLFTTYFLLFCQSSPILYYFYYSLPIVCWAYVWRKRSTFLHVYHLLKQNPSRVFKVVVAIIFVLCGLELLVLSFFFRRALSIVLLILSLWPYLTELVSSNFKVCVSWTVSCLLLAVFPHLPVVGRDANYTLVILAGVSASLTCLFLLRLPRLRFILTTPDSGVPRPNHLLLIQCVLLFVSAFVPAITNRYFAQKAAIPFIINIFSWFNLLFSLTTVHFGPKSLPGRLLHIVLSLYTVFILLSTTFEALFVLLLCVTLYLWLSMEELLPSRKGNDNKMTAFWESVISFSHPKVVTLFPNETTRQSSLSDTTHNDIRQVFFCIFFGILSFFGTGNIASINTFDPATVYCFLTVFSPFVMGALILWKMVIPFIFVSCVFNAIVSTLKRSLLTNVLLMLIMSDIMGLNFFFLVRDSGSWLEIGMSISHYVIMMVMIIGIVLLISVARLLTGVTVLPRKIEDHLF